MKTFFMVKPDGVKRNIVGQVINRVEQEGFTISKMKMMNISTELAEEHYGEHKDKPFFQDVVSEVRRIMGATNPSDADAGTIRADFATKLEENVVHGSDSEESAERELSLFFNN